MIDFYFTKKSPVKFYKWKILANPNKMVIISPETIVEVKTHTMEQFCEMYSLVDNLFTKLTRLTQPDMKTGFLVDNEDVPKDM